MTESPRIDGLLRRIRGEVRRRRAEYYGVRGAFWGAVGGVAVLLSKAGIGSAAPWIAVAVGGVGVGRGGARGARELVDARGDVAAPCEGSDQALVLRGARLRPARRRQRCQHDRRSLGDLQGHLAGEPAT